MDYDINDTDTDKVVTAWQYIVRIVLDKWNTSGQNILTKGCITCRAVIFGIVWLNDPFCCIHHSNNFRCFSVSRITPEIAPSHGGSGPRLMHRSLGPRESASQMAPWSVEPSLHSTSMWWTHHATLDSCSSRPHLMHYMHTTRPNNISYVFNLSVIVHTMFSHATCYYLYHSEYTSRDSCHAWDLGEFVFQQNILVECISSVV